MIPIKRKEKSLSSLVVSTSHIATQTCSTGRRTKAVAKRAVNARDLRRSTNESSEKDDNIVDKYVEKSNSIEKMRKVSLKRKQVMEVNFSFLVHQLVCLAANTLLTFNHTIISACSPDSFKC